MNKSKMTSENLNQMAKDALRDIFELMDRLKDENGNPLNYFYLDGVFEGSPFSVMVARNQRAEEVVPVLTEHFKLGERRNNGS